MKLLVLKRSVSRAQPHVRLVGLLLPRGVHPLSPESGLRLIDYMPMLKSSTSRRIVCLWNDFGIVEGVGGDMVRTEYFQMSVDRKSASQRRGEASGDHRTCVIKPLKNCFNVPHAALVSANE